VGPHEVLRIATWVLRGKAGYEVEFVGERGTLLVPGGGGTRELDTPVLVAWIRQAAARAERIVSVCTGSFLLARAGLLDGLPATTHWRAAGRFAAEHPEVEVRPDPIFVRAGRIWTSAGVTAGMDLALALVEQAIAREPVLPVRRAGGQSQYASPVWSPPAPRPSVRSPCTCRSCCSSCRTGRVCSPGRA
jgi:transcriptional regulator GlxA family with amidase domain